MAAFFHVAKACIALFIALPGAVAADTVIVSPDGLGDYTTIQEAVDDLPNSGPRVVVVRAGIYYESVEFWRTNVQASSEADRIVLMADPLALAGSVMIVPGGTGDEEEGGGSNPVNSKDRFAFRLARTKYLTIKGFAVTGASRSAILLRGGGNSNSNIIVEGNDVYDNGLDCGNCAAITIKGGNDRTWVVNNLVRHNRRQGVWVGEDDDEDCDTSTYIVNNTIFANGWNGIMISACGQVHVANNLIVGNDAAPSPPVAAGQRWGLKVGADEEDENDTQPSNISPEQITLTNNVFFNNGRFIINNPGTPPMKGGDILNPALAFDSADSGNWTTTGAEGPDADGTTPAAGIAGVTPAAAFSDIFVDPVGWDFHLVTGSPAIDLGANSVMHGGKEWVPAKDFEGDDRPVDGDGQGDAVTDVGHDEAVPPISVEALASPTGGPVPLAVVFDAAVVGDVVLYAWDFDGDGVYDYSSSTSPQTVHTYTDVSTFSATIRVTTSSGQVATDQIVITTAPGLQAIASANPTSGQIPLTVTFTPSGVSTGSPILWYSWDYNGDGVYDTGLMPRPDPTTHTYFVAGAYSATLRIQDASGATATDSVEITVQEVPPTAVASLSPSNGPAPLTVNFNGTGSSPDGGIVLYEWDFDGDGTFDYSSSTTGNLAHTYDTPGSRQPVFRVTDGISLTASVSDFLIEVGVGEPNSPTAVAAASVSQGNAPLAVDFSCAGSNDPGGSLVLYEWDFDYDGSFAADFSSSSSCNTSHTYTAGGVHYAALRVTDNDGLTGTDVVAVVVNIAVTLAVLDDTFDPHMSETTIVRTTLSADADVQVFLRNWAGAAVRTLFQGPRAQGTYDDAWDGRDDFGDLLVDAGYFAYIDYTVGGVVNTKPDQPSGNLQYQATYTESTSNGGVIALWDDLFWAMNFRTLSYGASEMTLTITPFGVGNVIVAEPYTREVFGAGIHTAYWEGLTSAGQYITDSDLDIGSGGDFLWAAFGYTLPDNAIVIQGGRPVVMNPTATPNYVSSPDSPACIGNVGTDIGFTLSREASVMLRAFSMNTSALVGQVITAMLPAGAQSVNWDCRSVSGDFVEAGNYYIEITATAADGNICRLRRVLVQVYY